LKLEKPMKPATLPKDPTDKCWCCTLPRGPLVPIDLKRDRQLLGLPYDDCPPVVNVCPSCAEFFRSYLNEKLKARQEDQDRKPGRKKTPRKRA
jgi:hypothetical protein